MANSTVYKLLTYSSTKEYYPYKLNFLTIATMLKLTFMYQLDYKLQLSITSLISFIMLSILIIPVAEFHVGEIKQQI